MELRCNRTRVARAPILSPVEPAKGPPRGALSSVCGSMRRAVCGSDRASIGSSLACTDITSGYHSIPERAAAPVPTKFVAMPSRRVVEEQAFGAGRLSWVCDAGLTCAVSRSIQSGTTRESRPTLQPPMPSSTWPRREAFKHASRGFSRKLHSATDARVLESRALVR